MEKRDLKKKQSHELIQQVASWAIRSQGMENISIHKVMQKAGLTVGGFYAHYENKEALLGDAFKTAFFERRKNLRERIKAKSLQDWLSQFLELYLTENHKSDLEGGCLWAATLSDLSRASDSVRSVVQQELLDSMKSLTGSEDFTSSKSKAYIQTLAIAFGALGLARAVENSDLSKVILETCLEAGQELLNKEQ